MTAQQIFPDQPELLPKHAFSHGFSHEGKLRKWLGPEKDPVPRKPADLKIAVIVEIERGGRKEIIHRLLNRLQKVERAAVEKRINRRLGR